MLCHQQNPPNFLRQADLRDYVSPVVRVSNEGDSPDGSEAGTDTLIDLSVPRNSSVRVTDLFHLILAIVLPFVFFRLVLSRSFMYTVSSIPSHFEFFSVSRTSSSRRTCSERHAFPLLCLTLLSPFISFFSDALYLVFLVITLFERKRGSFIVFLVFLSDVKLM